MIAMEQRSRTSNKEVGMSYFFSMVGDVGDRYDGEGGRSSVDSRGSPSNETVKKSLIGQRIQYNNTICGYW